MLSIFTPTYNRKSFLPRLYESLCRQVNKNFEWIVIDDGSTDGTEEYIRTITGENHIPIVYRKQKNGGKHRAYNKALELAEGDYFLCCDSDDWLAEDAVENILSACIDLPEQCFVAAYKEDETGKRLSEAFPGIIRCTLQELSEKYHCGGELSLIFPTSLARQFPFPTFDGEKFITEAVVYDRISKVADVQLLPQVITICEYQEAGLSNNLNRIMKNNPAGYCLYFMQRIDIAPTLKKRIIAAGKYHCFCIFAGNKKSKYTGKHKTLVILTKPLGTAFCIYKRKREF